jgi:hypothetical protein
MLSAAEIKARLCAHTLPGLESILPQPEYVMPHYEGLGIANLPATIAALLGAELPGACPPLERDLWADWRDGLKRIILVVMDALGYLQLQATLQADLPADSRLTSQPASRLANQSVFQRLAEVGRLVPITSTFPSTTNTVLTTLWTGYSPAAHGVLAYELYLRELGVAASALFFWPIHYRQRDILTKWGLQADTFVPVPGLAKQLSTQGIDTYALISKAYSGSFLSKIHRRGTQEVIGFAAAADMWLELPRLIERQQGKKLFVTAYWDTMDSITHRCGPDDDAWPLELRGISRMMKDAFLNRLTPAQRKGTLLLLTADHGGVQTPPQKAIQLDDHPTLRDALTLPPVGESRVPFFYARPDTISRAQAYIRQNLGHAFVTLTREQVLSSGLLGPGEMDSETPHRLGDLVCVARGSHYLASNKHQLDMLGRHGGLLPSEMLVPLLGVRLDALE